MSAQTWPVQCSGCPRTYSMTLATIDQRKNCTFCGAALIIPEDMQREFTNAKMVSKVLTRKTIQCPLCLRDIILENAAVGRRHVCSYCTCPYVLDSALNPKPQIQPLPFPEPVRENLGRVACGHCGAIGLKPNETAPAEGLCKSCNSTQELYALPLAGLIELPGKDSSALVETACAALLARWERRDVGLAEAWWILEELTGVDRALNSDSSVLNLLSPVIAAEVAQFGIFSAPSADVFRDEAGVTLILARSSRDGAMTGIDATGTLALNAVGLSLLAVTGRGFVGVKREDGDRKADPALLLRFEYCDEGSTLRASIRNENGNILPLPPAEMKKISSDIDQKLPDAVRRLYVFKSIFGSWITGAMLYGMPPKALKTRLLSLGGSLARQADALSDALTNLPE
jgi:hypothetical protein